LGQPNDRPQDLIWHRAVEDHSVAIATFETPASELVIESGVVIQHFNAAPPDFLVDAQAVDYPFAYCAEDRPVPLPYMDGSRRSSGGPVMAIDRPSGSTLKPSVRHPPKTKVAPTMGCLGRAGRMTRGVSMPARSQPVGAPPAPALADAAKSTPGRGCP
jgi:hypothetical protein